MYGASDPLSGDKRALCLQLCSSASIYTQRQTYSSTMKAMLRLCTLLLGVSAAWTAVLPMKDFSLDQVEGKWYLVGFATNADWFVRHKSTMKMGTAMLKSTADGDLEMSCSNLKEDGTCWRMQHTAKKTNTPGHFTYYNERWQNDNDVRIVEVKSDEYSIIHIIKTKNDKTDVLNKLLARTSDVSDDVKNKFKKFSLDTGILPENIVMLPPNGECKAE